MGRLRPYLVKVHGIEYRLLLTAEDAERRGGVPVKVDAPATKEDAPLDKARKPRNKGE